MRSEASGADASAARGTRAARSSFAPPKMPARLNLSESVGPLRPTPLLRTDRLRRAREDSHQRVEFPLRRHGPPDHPAEHDFGPTPLVPRVVRSFEHLMERSEPVF